MPFYTGLCPLNAGKKNIDMVSFGKELKLIREYSEGSEVIEMRDILFFLGRNGVNLLDQ